MENKKLIDLHEWNSKQTTCFFDTSKYLSVPNGIACPICGHELVDANRNIILASNPPQYDVRCPNCTYRGYRVC